MVSPVLQRLALDKALRRRVAAAVTALAAALALLYSRRYYVGAFNDDAYYVVGGRSLPQGRYAVLSDPAEPPMTTFGPGYPLFLAPFAAMAAPRWGALKAVGLAVTAASCAAAVVLFGPWLSPSAGLLLLAAYALNARVLSAASWVMTEPFLTLLAAACFLLLRRLLERDRAAEAWLLGALLGWAAVSRPTGAVLTAAVAAGLLLGKRRSSAARAAAVSAGLWLAAAARNAALAGTATHYLPRWQQSVRALSRLGALADNVQRVANIFFVEAPFGLRLPYSSWGWAINAALVLTVCFGLWRGFRAVAARGPRERALAAAIALYCAALFAAHCSWAAIDARYALPVLPFLLGFLAAALPVRLITPAAALAALSIAGSHADLLARSFDDAGSRLSVFPARAVDWLRGHTEASALLVSQRPVLLYLYSGRHAVIAPEGPAGDAEEYRYALLRQGVGYIVDTPFRPLYRPRDTAQPADLVRQRLRWTASVPGAYRPVFADAEEASTVYEVLPDADFVKAFDLYLTARGDLEAGRYDDGFKKLDAALAVRPDLVKALNAYGAASVLSGTRLAAGEAKLKRALDVDPHHVWAWLNLARLYRKRGRLIEARAALDRAARELPLFPNLLELGPTLARERAELEPTRR